MNILCLADFNQGDVSAKAGDVLTMAPSHARWLLDSWPGYWAQIEIPGQANPIGKINVAADMGEVTAALEAPPKDKMIQAPTKAKAKRKG